MKARSEYIPSHVSHDRLRRAETCPPAISLNKLLRGARQTLERTVSTREEALFASWVPSAYSMTQLVSTFTAARHDVSLRYAVDKELALYESAPPSSYASSNGSAADKMLELLDTAVRSVRSSEDDFDDARATVFSNFNKTVADRDVLRRLIKITLNDSDAMKAVKKGSYAHDNGFDKIVLGSHANWKLRLHVWWPDSRHDYQENAHDHRWAFASTMIIGSYRTQLLRKVDADDPAVKEAMFAKPASFVAFNHLQYSSANTLSTTTDAAGAGAGAGVGAGVGAGAGAGPGAGALPAPAYSVLNLSPNRLADLEIVEDIELHPGQSFVFPLSFVHRIIDEANASSEESGEAVKGALTLMITAPSAKTTCNLFSQAIETEGEEGVAVPRFTDAEIRARLLRIIDCLDAERVLFLRSQSASGGGAERK